MQNGGCYEKEDFDRDTGSSNGNEHKEVTDDGIIHGLESLQLVFPEIEKTTTTKVTVKEAVCITDADEIGTVYKSGKVE